MRPLVTALVAASIVGLTIVLVGRSDEVYRVNAVFDTADGVAAGYEVKVAGVEVGAVEGVRLGADDKAHTRLRLDPRFGPFKSDARCRILPQSLISEKFIECDPGNAADDLPTVDGTPTVPITHTSVPVAVQDLLDIFARPTNERLRLLLNELGISVSGRASDINEILRRGNPTLQAARRLLDQVNDQRTDLAEAIGQTDTVLQRLATSDKEVRSFIVRTADLASTAAGRREQLQAAVRDLPAMLSTATSSLTELGSLADAATPLMSEVRAVASPLERVLREVPTFVSDALPAVSSLRSAAAAGIPAARSTAPRAKQLVEFGKGLGFPADRARDLLLSLRDRGALERVPWWLYNTGASAAGYDAAGHAVNIQLTVNTCLAVPSTPGCDARFQVQAGKGVPQAFGAEREPRKKRKARGRDDEKPSRGRDKPADTDRRPSGPATRPEGPAVPPSNSAPFGSGGSDVPPVAPGPGDVESRVRDLLDLLGSGGKDVSPAGPGPGRGQVEPGVSALLDYLLGP